MSHVTPPRDRTAWPVHHTPEDDSERLLRVDMRLQRVEQLQAITNDRLFLMVCIAALATMTISAYVAFRIVTS